MDLPQRLAAIAQLVAAANKELEQQDLAGFLPYDPHVLAQAVLALRKHAPSDATSLDLGAGTGGWWLLAAAAGLPSYGIELHPELVRSAQALREECIRHGLISPTTPCVLVEGDMIPARWDAAYAAFISEHADVAKSMPRSGGDAYAALGVRLGDADIIYCWAWPTQSRFLFNMLAKEARDGALLVLPSYVRYTQGEHMNAAFRERNELILEIVDRIGDVVIGRKA